MSKLWKMLTDLFAWFKKSKPDPVKPTLTDALPITEIASAAQGQADWLRDKWPATRELVCSAHGRTLTVNKAATAGWKSVDDNCGSMWFIVRRDGAWRAYCWDQIRAGQTSRHLPLRTDTPKNYETIIPGEETYVVTTGMCRDKRRNVSERTTIARLAV